jgi:hypothetical protein
VDSCTSLIVIKEATTGSVTHISLKSLTQKLDKSNAAPQHMIIVILSFPQILSESLVGDGLTVHHVPGILLSATGIRKACTKLR